MAKRKKAKQGPRYLEFAKPIVIARPPGARPTDLVQALAAAVLTGSLPPGWKVKQPYRNSPTKPFKEPPVEQMLKASSKRGGDFNGLYFNQFLRRQANRYGVTLGRPRQATPKEIEADEALREKTAARESGEFAALSKTQKQSAAAKRGWKTRRKRAATRKRATKKKRG